MMGLQPSRVEYDLGANRHGQPVKLVRDAGQWVLLRHQANQRDDSARIELTDQQIDMIGLAGKDR